MCTPSAVCSTPKPVWAWSVAGVQTISRLSWAKTYTSWTGLNIVTQSFFFLEHIVIESKAETTRQPHANDQHQDKQDTLEA